MCPNLGDWDNILLKRYMEFLEDKIGEDEYVNLHKVGEKHFNWKIANVLIQKPLLFNQLLKKIKLGERVRILKVIHELNKAEIVEMSEIGNSFYEALIDNDSDRRFNYISLSKLAIIFNVPLISLTQREILGTSVDTLGFYEYEIIAERITLNQIKDKINNFARFEREIKGYIVSSKENGLFSPEKVVYMRVEQRQKFYIAELFIESPDLSIKRIRYLKSLFYNVNYILVKPALIRNMNTIVVIGSLDEIGKDLNEYLNKIQKINGCYLIYPSYLDNS